MAATYEAKAVGIKTWAPIWEAKRILWKSWVYLKPDIWFYGQVSASLMGYLKNYSNSIEIFSIDEAFIDITWMNDHFNMSYPQFLEFLRLKIRKNIQIPVSIWASNTKLLAKMFAELNKPNWTFFANTTLDIDNALKNIELCKIPFIWKASESKIHFFARSAYDFKYLDHHHVQKVLKLAWYKLWLELNWTSILNFWKKPFPKGISRTGSFNPNFISDKNKLFKYLIYNFERAFEYLIDLDMGLKKLNIFLRKKDFWIESWSVMFGQPVSDRKILINSVSKIYDEIFKNDVLYRSTWVNFEILENQEFKQMDLLNYKQDEKNLKLSKIVNQLNNRFWRFTILSAASLIKSKNQRIIWLIGKVL